MDEDLYKIAQRYAQGRGITLGEQLGSGIHGIVLVAEQNSKPGLFAIKFHREDLPFEREYHAYRRLQERRITRVLGFNVPRLLEIDEQFKIIAMTIVRPPFVLDFADAYLDHAPDFPDDVVQQWEKDKQEIFEKRWPKVMEVLNALRGLGIHLLDVNAGNITFGDSILD